ncbi:efflux RND transporter periplasmic adaptor subunit, partial [Rhodopseudomonas sp. WA056]|uniref:efflux RND transporter periplasmic adaptor subunit n=1 Tax=Rhodopseudomonas sp. WA056 TaxID=2269367 RepID=UPI001968175C
MDMKQPTQKNEIVIDPVRLQAIGITSEPVRRQNIEKTIRTVGRVAVVESLVAHIHVRFDGWIEKLFINFTGEKVKAGQALFTVYSPDLVSTQQEYLLALNAQKILSQNTT